MLEKLHEIDEATKTLIWYAFIGITSGVVEVSTKENKNKTNFEKFCVILTALSFAVFLTPTVIWLIEINFNITIPNGVCYGIGFAVSKVGEKTFVIFTKTMKAIDWVTFAQVFLDTFKNKKK